MGATGAARSVVGVVRDRNVTFLAASVAYYAFVSIIPLLTLILVVGSIVGGESFAEAIVEQIQGSLSGSGASVVEDALTNESGRAGAGLVSVLFLLWSAIKVFRGIDIAFDEVYDAPTEASLVEQIRDGVVVAATVTLGIGLMVAVGAVLGLSVLAWIPFIGVLSAVVLLLGLVVVFLPLYFVMPPVEMSVRSAVPGAAFAAVGWIVLQFGFQLYTANADKYAAYGLLGAVLLFVTWLYFAGILLLVGAAINYVLDRGGTATGTTTDTSTNA